MRAMVENDLAALAAMDGDFESARARLNTALALDPACAPAKENSTQLDALRDALPQPGDVATPALPRNAESPIKVAILSLLFNWPSTGGGTVHTAEAGKFLGEAGYKVRHIYARYPG